MEERGGKTEVDMGMSDWINKAFNDMGFAQEGRAIKELKSSKVASTVPCETPVFSSDNSPWFMPTFQGRDICDWVDDIARMKREGNLQQALLIAEGCMKAMIEASVRNPANVMEFYVVQVAIIQRKMKSYAAEIYTIETWLSMNIPPTRDDHRLDLEKRLAKAKEMLAKENGQDASPFTLEWKRLVELEKRKKIMGYSGGSGSSTGKSAASPSGSYIPNRRSPWVAPEKALNSPSFVAVDFETANRQGGVSACQIALVKIHEGRIVDRMNTLIKPPRGFDSFEFTYLHGIAARDVRHSPSWMDIAPAVDGFVKGLPVYAHNAAFDAKVWRNLDEYFGTRTLPTDFYCSYRTAQRLIPGLENYKLPTVSAALVPNYRLNHHRADSDAEACALIVAALQSLSQR